MKRAKILKNITAMTLVEVMIAMSIFSIMSLLTVQTLTGGFRIKRNLDNKYTKYQTVRAIFLIMERDIRLIHHHYSDSAQGSINKLHSIYVSSDVPFNSFFVGSKERIDFTTLSEYTYQYNAKQSRLAELSYYIEPNELGLSYKLMRRKSSIVDDKPTEGGEAVAIADNIAGIEFKFLDTSNTIQDTFGSWTDEWNSTEGEKMQQFPVAIEINISFMRGENSEETFTDIVEILSPHNVK